VSAEAAPFTEVWKGISSGGDRDAKQDGDDSESGPESQHFRPLGGRPTIQSPATRINAGPERGSLDRRRSRQRDERWAMPAKRVAEPRRAIALTGSTDESIRRMK